MQANTRNMKAIFVSGFIILYFHCLGQSPVNLHEIVWSDFPGICEIDHANRVVPMVCYTNLKIDSSKSIHITAKKSDIVHHLELKFYSILALNNFEFVLLNVKIKNPIEAEINHEYLYRLKGFSQYDGHHFLGGLLPVLVDKKDFKFLINEIIAQQDYLSKTDFELMTKGLKRDRAVFSSNYANYIKLYPKGTWPKALSDKKSFSDEPQLSNIPLFSY